MKEQGRGVTRKATGSPHGLRRGEEQPCGPRVAPAAAGALGWSSAWSLPPHRCGRAGAGSPGQPLSWVLEVDGAWLGGPLPPWHPPRRPVGDAGGAGTH